jgi:hypothetical protein
MNRATPDQMRRLVRGHPFEMAVLGAAVLYAALQLSPSSYALALAQLGESVSPWAGTPQPIRSDEWAILTPLVEATVNNHHHVVNATSFYGESLLSIFGLPIANWGIAFKPQLWLFFITSPSFAYSVYWASMAALMMVGWSLLLRQLDFSRKIAALVSLLLFFSPFVQTWWTIFDSQLAFLPWIVLAAIGLRSNVAVALALTLLVPMWLLSFLYLPGVPPLIFLAVVLCLAFRASLFNPRRVLAVVSGGAVGAFIAFVYYHPVLDDYANSVFPGQRWINGGGLMDWQALSQVLPGITTERYTPLVGPNICEISTVCSWLPLLALCMADVGATRRLYPHDKILRRDVRRVGVLIAATLTITLWQLTPYFVPLSYLFGWGVSPEQRTLFASGALLVLAAGYAMDRLPIRVSAGRLSAFGVLVVASWLLASELLQPIHALELRDELLVLVPLAAVFPLVLHAGARQTDAWRTTLVLVALLPMVVGWSLFNPVQRTTEMFRRPDTAITRSLNALQARRPDGAIAVPGFAGAVLNGVGYRSVSHVIPTPSPSLFVPYFSYLDKNEFNVLFNRYENVGVADVDAPRLITADYVQLPIKTMARYAATP